ncbi:MAG: permease [Alkalispirochaeta sp.]
MDAVIITAGAVIALLASLIVDLKKTGRALVIAGRRFLSLLPAFLVMLAFVSIVLALVPEEAIVRYLGGENRFLATAAGALVGSVALMPGFVAFPLAGILLEKGVTYMTLSAFTTSLMIVGVLSYPIEKRYLGTRVTIIRNALSFLVAVAVALVTGLYFGELL